MAVIIDGRVIGYRWSVLVTAVSRACTFLAHLDPPPTELMPEIWEELVDNFPDAYDGMTESEAEDAIEADETRELAAARAIGVQTITMYIAQLLSGAYAYRMGPPFLDGSPLVRGI